ncbi:MAG: hypothetical protein AAFN50_03895 [Pseudomonadota bacterium]
MGNGNNDLNLVLVADRPELSQLLSEQLQQAGVSGVIRRMPFGGEAIACAKRSGNYRWRPAPDLVIFDYSRVDEYATDILRQLAFGDDKAKVPVVIITTPVSQAELDDGKVDGGDAVMFSPTEMDNFVAKMRNGNRGQFFKALKTLYQYGPILVRTPGRLLEQDSREFAMSA